MRSGWFCLKLVSSFNAHFPFIGARYNQILPDLVKNGNLIVFLLNWSEINFSYQATSCIQSSLSLNVSYSSQKKCAIQRKGHLKGKRHQILNQLNFTVEVRVYCILVTYIKENSWILPVASVCSTLQTNKQQNSSRSHDVILAVSFSSNDHI